MIEKVIKKKDDNLFNEWIDKKESINKLIFF